MKAISSVALVQKHESHILHANWVVSLIMVERLFPTPTQITERQSRISACAALPLTISLDLESITISGFFFMQE